MNKIIWTELKRFVKRNYKKAVLIALAVGITYSLATNFLLGSNTTLDEIEPFDDPSIITEEQAEYFTGFQIYIEYEDGRSYTNTTLLEEYVIQPEVVREAENETGVSILSRMEQLEESGFEKQGNNRGVLGVIRGNHSNVFTIMVNVGSDVENMEVANFYYNRLTDGVVSFLENKEVHVWSEPQLLIESDSEIPETDELPGNFISGFTADIIVGTLFGLIVAMLGLLLLSVLRNKDLYSFSYNRGSDDIFLLHDSSKVEAGETAQLIAYPLNYDKVIIHNTALPEDLKNELDKKLNMISEKSTYSYVNKMSEAYIHSENTEVVILLNSLKDSKKWYNAQRRLADTYNLPVKVVQIND
ncbi:hypothetical protein GCM10008929_01960 [Alkalibacterium psychrotolerans]